MKRKSTTLLLLTLLLTILSVLPAYAGTTEDDTEQLLEKCIKLESDQEIAFSSEDEWMRFAYFYINNYELNNCELLYYPEDNSITIADDNRYDRAQVVDEILNTLGPVPGTTTTEIINNACQMTTDAIRYNADYTHASVEEALLDGQGVCWQRAKICATLLREQDIPCDIVYGYAGSNVRTHKVTHVWLRCQDGDNTIYVDPNKGILSSDEYASNYKEISLDEWSAMQYAAS
jgi:transglutaminase-like putative cysteine protease